MEDERLLLSDPHRGGGRGRRVGGGGRRRRAHPRALDRRLAGRATGCTGRRASTSATERSHRYDWTHAGPRDRPDAGGGDEGDAHDHRARAAVDLAGAAAPQPALTSRIRTCSRCFAKAVGDALPRPRRPLPDLERAEPSRAGWSRSRRACARRVLHAGLAAHLPRARARGACPRSSAPTRAPRSCSASSAPRGHRAITTRSPVSPLPFLRELACVDRRYKPMRRGPCRGFKPARADAFGYHPHGRRVRARRPQPGPRRGPDRRPAAAVLACSTG